MRGAFGPGAAHPDLVREERIHLGWGEDLVERGRIGAEPARRAAAALERLAAAARAFGCGRPPVLVANALRSAPDRAEVLDLIERLTGARVFVLSGRGEAALGFLGAASGLRPGTAAALADPGGTSTEIAWGIPGRVDGTVSAGWGTHSVARLLRSRGGGIPPAACRRAIGELARIFGTALAAAGGPAADSSLPADGPAPTILMTGGTAVAIAAIARWMRRREQPRVGHDLYEPIDLEIVVPRIAAALRGTGAGRYPIEEERRELLLPGLVLALGVARALGTMKPTVTARDLRWGAVLAGTPLTEEYLADE